jgi:opacity protein-like surface antigen
MGHYVLRIFALAMLAMTAAGAAQAASVQALFERYGLIGTWAFDCAQPASEQNPYIFYRVLDPEHVARDTMSSPTNRANVSVADFLVESNPNEVVIMVKTERWRTNLTVRLERKRMRTFQSTRDSGEKVIVNGRFTERNTETLWYSKCGP